ncbi:hypothetical protein J31TS6_34170 [Brevibacillus reuszeri]|uniref:hypothetical protein n=1 Tax=Brevibacillus reuszeri TaxID=54915 RepID=UPI001B278D97|nr:hypothetical protein [Brevibacillus reuszeri]GIO07389.1 hypothetical protein J31TS6_34170 [Brevibacillus reuszeri]
MEMEAKIDLILSKLEGLEKGQNSLHQEVAKIKEEVTEIKEAVFRLEDSQPQDIQALPESMSGKLDSFRYDMEFIVEKQAMQDMKIKRIEKRIQS